MTKKRNHHSYNAKEKAYNKKKTKYRSRVNKLRREAEAKGLVKKGDGKEVHHTEKGGKVKTSRVVSRKKNRTMANQGRKKKR